MKRFLALAALVLGVVSCQTEPEGLDVNVGGEIDAIVNVTIPEAETRATNSAEGAFKNVNFNDYTIRYILQVYYKGEPSKERLVKYSDGKSVVFPVRLVPGRDYSFVVWADLVNEGKEYDELIKSLGGIDLQLLGIGFDGHIGFNEPDSVFTAQTHPVELDESTIEANARFFASKDDVPRQAVTMGMMSIMQAKKILLIANGQKKKEVIEKAFSGPVDPMMPASILQLHPDVTVIFSEN